MYRLIIIFMFLSFFLGMATMGCYFSDVLRSILKSYYEEHSKDFKFEIEIPKNFIYTILTKIYFGRS